MIDRFHARTWGLQQWLWLMLLACFALRSLVVPGYMPSIATGSNKLLKLAICTAQGVKTISVSDSDPPPDGHGAPGTNEDCGFAGLTQLVQLTHPDAVFGATCALLLPAAFVFVVPREPVRRTGPTLGSRGPPATA
ncbi:MAG: hypothetical protein B7Y80_09970 [Hyphomicrobium sp. 32-62-53]|nr:MAG: hypothetical protein B7Z29_08755 [Hyphomicrobium sp. 12-62-95]OYX99896.1 MAG: hypothetical protein B7Y80_09970 [Hyphomicrobium sp. 32-62-53]